MILFSAEAIFASSTSKFGIWIPLVDDEDLRTSTESAISTSLIRSIASAGNCGQVHTSVLNLIFHQANVAGVGNLSKWRSEIWDDWIFGWRSGLASLILNWCLILILLRMWWRVFWHIRTPWIQLLRIRCWRRRFWICKNVSRYSMCVPNAWRPIFAARHSKRTA